MEQNFKFTVNQECTKTWLPVDFLCTPHSCKVHIIQKLCYCGFHWQ